MKCPSLSMLLTLCLAAGVAPCGAAAGQARANVYRTSGSVELDKPVDGDLFAAAGRVRVTQPVAQDAMLAAGDIAVQAPVGQDLRAAAGHIAVGARIGGEARLAGGDVRLEPQAEISGPLWVTAGHVELLGRAGDGVNVHAGKLVVAGEVAGDVQAAAEQIELQPGARVHGRLRYASPQEARVAPGAVVAGGIEREAEAQPAARSPQAPAGMLAVFWIAGLFAAGTLWWLLFPSYARSAQAQLQDAPVPSLAFGAATLLGIPLLAMLLTMTIVGAPLALALMAAYALVLLAGYLVVASLLAERLLQTRKQTSASIRSRLGALALALLLLVLASLLPVVGWLLVLAALMAGTGALVRLGVGKHRAARTA